MKNRCEKNPRSKIKKDTDATAAWKSLKEYLPQGSRILNSLFQKLFGLTLASCNDNPTTYTDQFKDTLEQIENFSEKMKPEDNLLIFQFHRGLMPQYSSYFELYNQTYNTYKDDGTRTTKYTLDYTITRFLNTMSNPTSSVNHESSQALAALVNSSYRHTPQSVKALVAADQTEHRIQPGSNATNSRTVTQTMKHYSHCKKDWHDVLECIQLHPHLKKRDRGSDNDSSGRGGRNNGNRRGGSSSGGGRGRGRGKSNKDDKPDNNSSTASIAFTYAAISKIAAPNSSFVSALTASPTSTSPTAYTLSITTALSHLWIFDSGCTQHITRDRSVFQTFTPFTDQSHSVNGVHGMTFTQGSSRIQLECAGKNGEKRTFCLDNVWYVPDSGFNLISHGQLRDQKCPIRLADNTMIIGHHEIQFKLHPNRLFILDMWQKMPVCLAAISQPITAPKPSVSEQDSPEEEDPEQDEPEQDKPEQGTPTHSNTSGIKPGRRSKPINEATLRM